MFTKLRAMMQELQRTAEPIDPAQFSDDIAIRTEWSPKVVGGIGFTAHRLHASPSRLAFVPTIGIRVFLWIFILAGIIMILLPFLLSPEDRNDWHLQTIFSMLMGSLFLGISLWKRRTLCRSSTFDLETGQFCKGQTSLILISEIHALQIIKEHCDGGPDGPSFYSYELNLVLSDASRINIVDHANIEQIRSEAKELANFLGGIPLWDASSDTR